MSADEKGIENGIAAKAWDASFETPLRQLWRENHSHAFDPKGKGDVFSIDTPPPYVNSPVHIGHATTYTLMDMFARFQRMNGKRVLFPLGLDNNGLPIEMAAEKKSGKRLTSIPRDEALKLCRSVLEEAGMVSMETFERLGISFNSWEKGPGLGDVYETDSHDYRTLTQETFIELWEKGLIYEDTRINNWDPALQTTLADAEVTYEDIQSAFNDVIFKVKETGEDIIIGTTRPELVCTCAMVIYNPNDERYKKLKGKTAITPIFNKEVPIKPHPQADIDKGTGLVMMSSIGDLADVRFFRENNIKPVIAIGKDGRMNEHAGQLQGLKVKEARQKMIELLKEKELLVSQRQILHRTPISERSKAPIEFIAMPELYVRQLAMLPTMRTVAKDVRFFDERSRQILTDWIDSVSIDWPVTRRRFYATEVPLWYCKKCRHAVAANRGKYVQPWRDAAPVKACQKCKGTEFEGDTRVLDTWFDSSITPLYIHKWNRQNALPLPATLRPQGKEIVRTWLYYTLLRCKQLTDKTVFRDVWVHYHVVDEKGHKMSKSVGNVIDPKIILDKYGAEPFRFWCAVEGNMTTTDFRCSFVRIEGAGKTLTKLWNVVRFASSFPAARQPSRIMPLDAWIRSELAAIVVACNDGYAKYDMHNPTLRIRQFVWDAFASHYLEMVKARAYNREGAFTEEEQASALATIHHCVDVVLRLLAPVTPFITATLYHELGLGDVHRQRFPTEETVEAPDFSTTDIAEFNALVWKAKKDAGVSLRAPAKTLVIPKVLESLSRELQIMHAAEKISVGGAPSVGL